MHIDRQGIWADLASPSSRIVVTFGGFRGGVLALGGSIATDDDHGVPTYEFARSLDSVGVKRVYVRDHAAAWYHRGVAGVGPDIDAVASRLRHLTSAAAHVATLGNSAGGFGALLFAALLGAEAHAFSPQTFIDPALRAQNRDNRWAEEVDALGDDLDRRYADLLPVLAASGGRFHVYYAAGARLDTVHAERLAELPQVTLHPFRYDRHDLIVALRACGWLDEFVAGLVAGRTVAVPARRIPARARRTLREADPGVGLISDPEPGASRLVVTFGGSGGGWGPLAAEVAGHAGAARSSIVHVRDHAHAWYHRGVEGAGPDVDAVARFLRDAAGPAQHVVMVGSSVGGYAALLFGALLDAEVHAFSPPAAVPEMHAADDPRFRDLVPLIGASGGRFHVYFSAGSTAEAEHAARLANLPNVKLHAIPDAGEGVVRRLRRAGRLAPFVRALLVDGETRTAAEGTLRVEAGTSNLPA